MNSIKPTLPVRIGEQLRESCFASVVDADGHLIAAGVHHCHVEFIVEAINAHGGHVAPEPAPVEFDQFEDLAFGPRR